MNKLLIIFALLGMNCLFLFSQDCDSILIADENIPYRYQKINNRCEGFYRKPVASKTRIDIIGITKGKFIYDMDEAEVINILSPLVTNREVSVRAQAVPTKTYYRMDAVISPGDTVKWHVKDVLLPNRLASNMIRILGWYGSGDNKIYVPLRTKAELSTIIDDTDVYVTFRPTVKVENIQYSFYDYQTQESTDWMTYYVSSCQQGKPINLRLPLEMGKYSLVVSARIAGTEDEWIEKQIIINAGVN
jgi:hypothetical protein